MEQEAVRWMISNNKTALKTVHAAKFHKFRNRYPELHSRWVITALKTATAITHQFKKRKIKGKAKQPKLKKPFVSVNPQLFKVSGDRMLLKVEISKSANDLEPIVLSFKPHHKYKEVLVKKRKGSKRLQERLIGHWSMAREYGVPIVFVYAKGTSSTFPVCGGNLRGQDKVCPCCGLSRHYVAAINIACRGA